MRAVKDSNAKMFISETKLQEEGRVSEWMVLVKFSMVLLAFAVNSIYLLF